MFSGKKILVGVCGGIAVYKICELVRELQRKNAIVRTMLTPDATRFVSPLTFESLTGAPAPVDLFQSYKNEIEHIELATWPDIVVVAPATATTIAKFAHGIADNLLTATFLATRKNVLIIPAMNTGMWENPATKDNIALLRSRGYTVVEPAYGRMASQREGVGVGRLPEYAVIVSHIFRNLWENKFLADVSVTITAGCTREKIDPVRFISNYASGKMGFALAEAAAAMGADVTLVHGPTHIDPPSGIKSLQVESAEAMFAATKANYPLNGVLIGAAAVSDFRPAKFSNRKLKKDEAEFSIPLVKNPDILFELKALKKKSVHVGFALETNDEIAYAKNKLKNKDLDLIVVNNPQDAGAGFSVDTNKVKILFANGEIIDVPLMNKLLLSVEILKNASTILKNQNAADGR
ncbi:MAG: bifunctional phosphopantothenoylcysteine decarboxylase/phosphopantothenate--cysteine ligase CoaBC [Deferribacteres bacterium]|nr:bifunctional phosphopantothenoylcysteine decarboxylase/phosphopantothenate--cysteine ligase CoaBC [candidate division KSB1 bacterium]MCB9501488.1 bifunctional phosphopantothenoylcysteine decarboxylase/phosphopantothenate--cysteine ligase CoaBC [Deferribacteres bacterium]